MRGRREPNVGPGPAQIWRISGFVNSKTDGKIPQFCPNCDMILKTKKDLQASHADFSVSFRWSPLELMGPLLGPLKPMAFLKPMRPLMGPLKSMGPGVIVPPFPPFSGPDNTQKHFYDQLFLFFLKHTQFFLCYSQLRHQGDGAKEVSTPFLAKSLRKINFKILDFK